MRSIFLQSIFALGFACSCSTAFAEPDDIVRTSQPNSFVASSSASSNTPAAGITIELASNSSAVAPIDLTVQQEGIWARMRRGFSMPDLNDPVVKKMEEWYAQRPELLRAVLERGRPYLFFILEELEKRSMPSELALLPMVESAYNPTALSPAKAAGLWQFIPSTGKTFNLRQNWWLDQRRDVVASTKAALDYLQTIYEMHGDWHLALASYNWGENAVGRAIAKNESAGRPTDYLSLKMPAETRQYVPKLIALKNIIARPQAYGVDLPNISNQAYFVTIDKTNGIDVALAAKFAEMPLNEFLALNPAYNRPIIPAGSSKIVLPADKLQCFTENLEKHQKPLINWKTYSIPRIERVEAVANKLGIALQTLLKVNGLPAGVRLAQGYTLLIPTSVDETLLTPTSSPKITPQRRPDLRSHKRR